MVHALKEIERILVPGGILIDLRPVLDRWSIYVSSARTARETGRVQDFEIGLADDLAANQAITQAGQNGWFAREQGEYFSYIYSWDSATELEEWIEEEWNDFIGLNESTRRETRSAWATADGDARVQLNVKMLITRWRKRENEHSEGSRIPN